MKNLLVDDTKNKGKLISLWKKSLYWKKKFINGKQNYGIYDFRSRIIKKNHLSSLINKGLKEGADRRTAMTRVSRDKKSETQLNV